MPHDRHSGAWFFMCPAQTCRAGTIGLLSFIAFFVIVSLIVSVLG